MARPGHGNPFPPAGTHPARRGADSRVDTGGKDGTGKPESPGACGRLSLGINDTPEILDLVEESTSITCSRSSKPRLAGTTRWSATATDRNRPIRAYATFVARTPDQPALFGSMENERWECCLNHTRGVVHYSVRPTLRA